MVRELITRMPHPWHSYICIDIVKLHRRGGCPDITPKLRGVSPVRGGEHYHSSLVYLLREGEEEEQEEQEEEEEQDEEEKQEEEQEEEEQEEEEQEEEEQEEEEERPCASKTEGDGAECAVSR